MSRYEFLWLIIYGTNVGHPEISHFGHLCAISELIQGWLNLKLVCIQVRYENKEKTSWPGARLVGLVVSFVDIKVEHASDSLKTYHKFSQISDTFY